VNALRIAHVAPVATTIPPPKSGSVEMMTSLLTEGLVRRGHDVTLFATADSRTGAKLSATYPHGYWHDENMWPWELYEMLNMASAVERAAEFDIIHYEAAYYPISLSFARLSPTPIQRFRGFLAKHPSVSSCKTSEFAEAIVASDRCNACRARIGGQQRGSCFRQLSRCHVVCGPHPNCFMKYALKSTKGHIQRHG